MFCFATVLNPSSHDSWVPSKFPIKEFPCTFNISCVTMAFIYTKVLHQNRLSDHWCSKVPAASDMSSPFRIISYDAENLVSRNVST
ncbi:hypothetical protein OUZ56_028213 [Daphnia magna]|uniref:Uncharacterized protein n=1 Tax=Daphnia magna TaxID=35525 RepID=A0ABR0B383_9CRUS|nr:hypothetical protein OUZ56_028213 [Daphnia magna]